MRHLAALALAVVAILAAGCRGPAHVPPQPVGRVLACEMKVSGTWGFWLIYLDDGLQKRISDCDNPSPDWSPDGHRLVYSDGTRLRTARSDNADNRAMDGGAGTDPAWSPDGTEIAFGNSISIQSRRIDGGAARNWIVAEVTVEHPTWSPDGTRIAAIDSSGALLITDRTSVMRAGVGGAKNPDWSPDGATIALQGPDGRIQAWNVAAGTLAPLGNARGAHPSYLRDGSFLTVWKGPDDDVACVYQWDAAGSVGTRLTTRDEVRDASGNW